ncbi:MAG: hypothetical protein WKF42_08880 [Solirubrobacteraceae bacterium]
MKLRRRQKRKTETALDALASITKLWSEWQIGKRAGKGVAKAKKVKSPSKRVRTVGVVAVVCGAGAAVARKLKGGDPEPIYTPPARSEPVAPAAPAPSAPFAPPPPPLVVAPDPAVGAGLPAVEAYAPLGDEDVSAVEDPAATTIGDEADDDDSPLPGDPR